MMEGIIISGGQVEDSFVLRFLDEKGLASDSEPIKNLIAADAGLRFCSRHGLIPANIVGDFDSSGEQILEPYRRLSEVTIRQFVPEKDFTDTQIAVELAISMGWKKIWILGGTGTRLDHVLGNLQVLHLALTRGAEAVLVDPHNRITLHATPFQLNRQEQWGRYVSFFAWGGDVQDLTLDGFAYPLDHHRLTGEGSLAVSNEITAQQAAVSFSNGMLLCIESKD